MPPPFTQGRLPSGIPVIPLPSSPQAANPPFAQPQTADPSGKADYLGGRRRNTSSGFCLRQNPPSPQGEGCPPGCLLSPCVFNFPLSTFNLKGIPPSASQTPPFDKEGFYSTNITPKPFSSIAAAKSADISSGTIAWAVPAKPPP